MDLGKRMGLCALLWLGITACVNTSTAAGRTVYVAKTGADANNGWSWAAAKLTVQAGLNAAVAGDQVWVAAGTYIEQITLKSGVALYGGFAGNENPASFNLADRNFTTHTTILDGNQSGSVVTSPSGATVTTRIDGFTIRNGYGPRGGGVSLTNSSPTIANNVITGNTSNGGRYDSIEEGRGSGGGIYSSGGNPVITGNRIENNRAAGYEREYCRNECIAWDHEDCVVWQWTCSMVYEGAQGGGIYCYNSSPTMSNNTITGNIASNNYGYSGSDGNGGGVYCSNSSSPTIANCTIARNSAGYADRAGYGGGVYCKSSSPTISDCTISGNSVSGGISYFGKGGGIYCYISSPTIANCTITGNGAAQGGGFYFDYSSPTIANTILAFNSSGMYVSGTPILKYNCVYGNTAYNYYGLTDPTGTNGNISADPRLADITYGNVHIQPDSPCLNAGDDTVVQPAWLDMDGQPRVQNGRVDIGADESDGTTWPAGPYIIVRVSSQGNDANDGSSWTLAKRTVQAGIDAAATAGGEVWVQASTYRERITLRPYAHVYGGFAGTEPQRDQRAWAANPTILDGQAGGSVITMVSCQTSTIDGFIVRNGSAPRGGGFYCCYSSPTIANCTITGNGASGSPGYGGGIWCSGGAPTITNCTITGNNASGYYGYGGGVYCSGGSPTIANCAITGNSASAGGGVYCYGGTPTIAKCTITGNAGQGGAVYCYGGSPTIAKCMITGNIALGYSGCGGGFYCSGGSPTIANCTITGNGASNGGGVYCYGGTPTIANCTMTGNGASNGGGVYCYGGTPTIANCTITGNSDSLSGGGFYCNSNASPTIISTIVAFNSSGINKVAGSGTPILKYSCVYGNAGYNYSGLTDPTGANGNISADPKLADISHGNVHIQPDSPCLDAGDDAVLQPGWLDMDGQPRVQDGGVDIGADESDGTTWPVGPYVIVRVSSQGDDSHDGSSWALAKRTVQAGIDAAVPAGGEVWVQADTYPERITLHPYAHVYGGFAGMETQRDQRVWAANPTILDGQAGGPVITIRAGHRSSTIDAFIVRNGSAPQGGGVYCSQSSSPTITNCTIIGNSASSGGGVYCSTPTTIIECTITGNIASGTSSSYGGGVYCWGGIIANCTITGNSASKGGGVWCSGGMIANSTITGNSASPSFGGGVYCDTFKASPTITSTIVAFNSSGIHRYSPGVPILRHNCVYGNTDYNYYNLTDPTGTDGNISANPLFRSAGPGPDATWGTADDVLDDLRLLPGSPCIDAGNNADVPAGILTDLDGALRFFDDPATPDCRYAPGTCGTAPIVDMGAYEYIPAIPGDADRDGDVDASDLAVFVDCRSAPAVPCEDSCAQFDFDADDDVDQDDFGVFQRCFSGEDNPADLNCAD